MSLPAGHLPDDARQVITLSLIELKVFAELLELLFEAGNGRRRFLLLLLAPLAKPCAGTRVSTSLFVGDPRCCLYVDG